MGKIWEIQTEHVNPIKVLVEVLKEILTEVVIEIRRCDYMNKKDPKKKESDKNDKDDDADKEDSDSDSDSDSDEDSEKEDNNNKTEKEDKKDDDDKKNSGGIRIMTVDSTKTVLINLRLEAKSFHIFKCKPEKYEIGINLVLLHKHLKTLDKDDTLTMFVEDDNKQHLMMKVENQEKSYKSDFKIKLMDLDNQQYKIPSINFDTLITMPSAEFHKICRDMSHIAEYIEIKCSTNSITFSCKGDSSAIGKTYYQNENGVYINHTKKDNKGKPHIVQGIYELKNLILFTKCANLCTEIQIYMKMNYPICIKYTVATLGRILLCLSPIDEANTKGNFSDEEELYGEEEDKIKLKDEYKDEDGNENQDDVKQNKQNDDNEDKENDVEEKPKNTKKTKKKEESDEEEEKPKKTKTVNEKKAKKETKKEESDKEEEKPSKKSKKVENEKKSKKETKKDSDNEEEEKPVKKTKKEKKESDNEEEPVDKKKQKKEPTKKVDEKQKKSTKKKVNDDDE